MIIPFFAQGQSKIGGTTMNSEHIKNNDPIQLKQMIIFLKAELTKYEHKVKQYKDSYHYSVIENLEQENAQLTKEKIELTKKLNEMQQKRHIISIDTAWKTKSDWLPVNKQLNELMKKLKNDAGTDHKRYRKQERQITSLHKKFTEQKISLEELECAGLLISFKKQLTKYIPK